MNKKIYQNTVEEFYQLSVDSQHSLISTNLKKKAINEEIANWLNVKNLLEYMNETIGPIEENLLSLSLPSSLSCENNEKYLDEICKLNEIALSYKATEILYAKNQLNSIELENHLINFETVLFELKYPSSLFDDIYTNVLKLKEKNSSHTRIIISIFINVINKTDMKFMNDTNIDNVKLDESVTEIIGGEIKKLNVEGSFMGCSSLTQITIPSSVTSIGNYAFYACSSLTQIIIPSSVTEIGECAFFKCTSLTQITIPSSVTIIKNGVFEKCSSLTQVIIPSSVTSIGNEAFWGCSSLKQIRIPSSVTEIGYGVFTDCLSLTQILIPSSVKKIGYDAFIGCSSLKQISLPSALRGYWKIIGLNSNVLISTN